MEHAYYGPGFSSEECAAALRDAGLKFETLPDETDAAARRGTAGGRRIVGWFQGRMEFGPRALGNRSFLADPRRSDMRELLNRRSSCVNGSALAPSMLKEARTICLAILITIRS